MKNKHTTIIEHFDNTTIIIDGFGDDPLCEQIRILAASHRDIENQGMTRRPEYTSGETSSRIPSLTERIKSKLSNWWNGVPKSSVNQDRANKTNDSNARKK